MSRAGITLLTLIAAAAPSWAETPGALGSNAPQEAPTGDGPEAAQQPIWTPWSGTAEVGYLRKTGNTESTSFNAIFGIAYASPSGWRYSGELRASREEEQNNTVGEAYRLSAKTIYEFTPNNYGFITGSYEDDRFSGFEYQASVSSGYGYRLVETDALVLDLEIGPGFRRNVAQTPDASGTLTNEDDSEAILRTEANLEWALSHAATFKQLISNESSDQQAISRAETVLQTKIALGWTLSLRYNIKHTEEVPSDDIENTDTETSVNFAYQF